MTVYSLVSQLQLISASMQDMRRDVIALETQTPDLRAAVSSVTKHYKLNNPKMTCLCVSLEKKLEPNLPHALTLELTLM